MLFIVFFLLLGSFGPLTGLQGNLENIPVDSGHKAEDTLDGVPTHHRAKSSHMLQLFLERKANHMLQNITAITPAISSTSAELNGEPLLSLCTKTTKVPEWKNTTGAGEESDGRPDWQITIAAVLILLLLVGVTAAKFAVSAAIAMVTGLIGIIIWHIQNRVKRKKENEDLPLKAVEY
ncbi:hypothetical protein KOW79_018395 [Hemibagrus wyckioides]|uniref:Uncharacterized protein n=1 Tax=Hemibagrus wyckioides TaxID=337641 RepID=A0A9D3NAL9_9TELE|nr:hypothetical protein KOW79_018395 [Hemibagrus wyckioides]